MKEMTAMPTDPPPVSSPLPSLADDNAAAPTAALTRGSHVVKKESSFWLP